MSFVAATDLGTVTLTALAGEAAEAASNRLLTANSIPTEFFEAFVNVIKRKRGEVALSFRILIMIALILSLKLLIFCRP